MDPALKEAVAAEIRSNYSADRQERLLTVLERFGDELEGGS